MTYFSDDELRCQHCGDLVFDEGFRGLLDNIRRDMECPLPVSSGYRCPDHPIELKKERPGAHATGKAVDIAVSGEKALRLLEIALRHGVTRVGINQKGSGRFIHLDVCDDLPDPAIWSY